ncbi:MAG: hypothetical protein KAR65_03885 [Anaerolineales bacterium]|nr:hypothetical protein [Anaerolineales bacterium]
MSQEFANASKPFVIWIVANLLGFTVLVASLFTFPFLKSIPGIVASPVIITIPISLAQWIALRRSVPISVLWILTIPVGLLLAFLISGVIPDGLWEIVDDESTTVLTLLFLMMGFAIGLPQWLILRRQFSSSSIWLLGSSVGIGAGFGLVLATGLINKSEIISYTVAVLVYAIATGLILSWLLTSRSQSQSNLVNAT